MHFHYYWWDSIWILELKTLSLFLFSDLYKGFWPSPVSFGNNIWKGILVIFFLLTCNGFRIFKKFCCFKIQLPHFIIKTYCNKFLEYLLWGNYVWYVNIWSFWSFAHVCLPTWFLRYLFYSFWSDLIKKIMFIFYLNHNCKFIFLTFRIYGTFIKGFSVLFKIQITLCPKLWFHSEHPQTRGSVLCVGIFSPPSSPWIRFFKMQVFWDPVFIFSVFRLFMCVLKSLFFELDEDF